MVFLCEGERGSPSMMRRFKSTIYNCFRLCMSFQQSASSPAVYIPSYICIYIGLYILKSVQGFCFIIVRAGRV